MKLFSSRTSPFARKVRVALHEVGLFERIEEVFVDPFAAQPPAEFLAANPLSRIPALITDEGRALPDSGLILDWLQVKADDPLPVPAHRWSAARREVVADGVIEAAVATLLERRRPESIIYPHFLDRQRRLIEQALDMLELEAGALSPADERPNRADITTGVALAYLDFRMAELDWRSRAPRLAEWQAAFAERPALLATQPPPA